MKPIRIEEKDLKRLFISDTPGAKAWRFFKRAVKQLFFLAIIYFVLYFIINYPAFGKRIAYSVQPASVSIPEVTIPEPTPAAPEPNYSPVINIPKIGVSAPIIFGITADQIVPNLANGVVQYQDTALPGQIGNSVIVGHSSDYPWSTGHYKNIFALLDKLSKDDDIQIPYGNQVFTYKVTSTKVVKPTDFTVLKKSNTAQLTLITCYPVGTTRSRLIITAELFSGITTGTQAKEPAVIDSLPKPR
jgi:LPXTG-site transpeptidase (sortase) family protein